MRFTKHILYDGTEHISMASLEGMLERTVTINGMSKTYSVTGWRVGWAVAPEKINECDPQGARLFDCGCASAAAGGWAGCRWVCLLSTTRSSLRDTLSGGIIDTGFDRGGV